MNPVFSWVQSHASVALAVAVPVITAFLNIAFRFETPEEWVAFGEKNPKLANTIRLLRAWGFDPVKGLKALQAIVSKDGSK